MAAQVGSVPGSKSGELLERKNKVVARGAAVKDVDGNTFIDFYGGIGSLNIGHCPEQVVKAVQRQAEKLLHSCFMY